MTKQEFLDKLRRALNGNMAAGTVEDNIRFYENYFRAQMEQGRSEADILNELGDPRILARTLIDAAERAGMLMPMRQMRRSTGQRTERLSGKNTVRLPEPVQAAIMGTACAFHCG